jgi:SAM-dependent methyltransferase
LELHCPICASAAAEELDFRAQVPIAQNLLFRSKQEALDCATGTLHMVRCTTCGFAWNAAFDPGLLRYGADYENSQAHSPAFSRHLDDVAAHIGRCLAGRRGLTLLEIGCGQGDFLNRLADALGGNLGQLVGFDPAYRTESPIPAAARIERERFSAETSARLGMRPDAVVTRHVIEHVADPLTFLRSVRSVCAEGVPLFVETPSVQWILDGAVAHDLYYEHCSLFDAGSLRLALETAGFAVDEVAPCFGGQYILARAFAAAGVTPARRSDRPSNADYPARKRETLRRLAASLRSDAAAGEKVALWGAASKGVTIALLLGEGLGLVAAAIDLNPARCGTYMPVTALRVISPEQAQAAAITKAYVANPLYLDEIATYCRSRGWPLKLEPIE